MIKYNEPKDGQLLKMSKILAWIEIDPEVSPDTVWRSLRDATKVHFIGRAVRVLQEWHRK